MNPYATCLVIDSPPCCSHSVLEENWCRYFFCVYLPLLSKAISPWIASFDWFQSKWVFFKLCHGHGLWIRIIIKVVCNHCWEMYVDSCRLLDMILQNVYNWWKYCLPLVTLRGFPIRSSLGIPISQSLCALLSWVVVVFHPLGVYYPFCVYQREVDLHLLIMRVSSSFSFVACKKLNLALWPYFSPSCFEQGVEWFSLVPPLFRAQLLQDYRIF